LTDHLLVGGDDVTPLGLNSVGSVLERDEHFQSYANPSPGAGYRRALARTGTRTGRLNSRCCRHVGVDDVLRPAPRTAPPRPETTSVAARSIANSASMVSTGRGAVRAAPRHCRADPFAAASDGFRHQRTVLCDRTVIVTGRRHRTLRISTRLSRSSHLPRPHTGRRRASPGKGRSRRDPGS